VIEPSQVRILAYLHISFAGIFGFSKDRDGRRERGDAADGAARGVQVADANRDVIIGIKVRVGRGSSGIHGAAPLDIALQAANESACR
jgi:dihydroorotase